MFVNLFEEFKFKLTLVGKRCMPTYNSLVFANSGTESIKVFTVTFSSTKITVIFRARTFKKLAMK